MNDAHEAIIKIKMAFRPNAQQSEKAAVDLQPRNHQQENLVPNFGEYHEILLELDADFQVPTEINGDAIAHLWIPGDDGEANDFRRGSRSQGRSSSDMDDDASLDMTMQSEDTLLRRPAVQNWTAFDPDEDEEEDEEEVDAKVKGVRDDEEDKLSDIEVTRAADDSHLSEPKLTETSSFDKEHAVSPGDKQNYSDEESFPMNNDDDAPMPFADDDEYPMGDGRTSNIMRLSISNDMLSASASDDKGLIDGLDDSEEVDVSKQSSSKKRKRRVSKEDNHKVRRVKFDENEEELSNAHMKKLFQEDSCTYVHPFEDFAAYDPDASVLSSTDRLQEEMVAFLGYARLFTRPSVADDGACSKSIMDVFDMTTAPVFGRPVPIELNPPSPMSVKTSRTADTDEVEDAEIARQSAGTDNQSEGMFDDEHSFPKGDDGEFPPPDDDDAPMPFDDDEHMPPPKDDSGYMADDLEAVENESHASRHSGLSLGLVNDFVNDDDGEPRQEAGDQVINSTTKWHKHTIRVFKLLKDTLGLDDPDKPGFVSFNEMTKGTTSRRTASGVFFELLQLKTWDYIELEQDEAYADIKISPGIKFHENPEM
ncbi:hypothetical protein MPSEU_000405800 [Mayamaea pseudoterrestris]|nr:hypothetical protein MPSEU_000405800 [Mayamaea pseudoterrestris]